MKHKSSEYSRAEAEKFGIFADDSMDEAAAAESYIGLDETGAVPEDKEGE